MTENDFITSFSKYLNSQKGYSENTILSYKNDLFEFADFAKATYDVADLTKVTKVIIRSWLSKMKGADMNSKSVNRKLSALNTFFKYLQKEGLIKINPAVSIPHLKINKLLPVFVDEKKMEQLMKQNFYPNEFKGHLEYLIISFLYLTGVRVSELALLEESNINFSANVVLIHGKGNKQRIVPLSPELKSIIQDFIKEKKRLFENPHELLVVNDKNKPLSRESIYKIVHEILGEVTTLSKKSPHVLRHTFATHLSNHGASIDAIKDLLGHASLAATQIYTHTSIARLKEIYDKAHPKS